MEFFLHCCPQHFWLLLILVILTTTGKLFLFIFSFCGSIILLFNTKYFQNVFQQILTVFNVKNFTYLQSNEMFSWVPDLFETVEIQIFSHKLQDHRADGRKNKEEQKKKRKHQPVLHCFSLRSTQAKQQRTVKVHFTQTFIAYLMLFNMFMLF